MPPKIEPGVLADQTRLGRLLSVVENDSSQAQAILASLPAAAPSTQRIGITGSPGVGKSTLLNRYISHLRQAGHRVGVVAVDPTSPFSGGAILGDRLRFSQNMTDPGVFIRSLGSRGSLGGVTPGASAVAAVLEAAGYDRVLIETVGVGQTGYDVVCLAETVVVLFSPEGGDGLQMLKAGILEIGDVFAVNKSDRPGADAILKELQFSIELSAPLKTDMAHHGLRAIDVQAGDAGNGAQSAGAEPAVWQPPVLRLVASEGEGLDEFAAAVERHQQWLQALPLDHPRRRQRIARELAFVIRTELAHLLDGALAQRIDALAAAVSAHGRDMWSALDELRETVRQQL